MSYWKVSSGGGVMKIFTPDELCQEMRQSLDYYHDRMLEAQKRGNRTMEEAEQHVKDYKDKELKEYSDRIARCPIEFNSDKEMVEYQQFEKEHEECTDFKPMVRITGHGLGLLYELKCAGCGKEEHITDTEAY